MQSVLGQLILDVAISVALFMLACAIAALLQQFILPNVKWLYIVWFSVGMLPLVFYMRYRRAGGAFDPET